MRRKESPVNVPPLVFIRLAACWLLLCWAGHFFGKQMVLACLPLFEVVIDLVQSDFAPALDVVGFRAGAELRMSAILLRNVPLDHTRYLETASHIDYTTMNVFHVLVPAVLLLGILGAWPIRTVKDLAMRVVFGALALIGVLGMTTAFTLAGRFKIWLVEATIGSPAPVHEDWLVQWVMFSELGGRWLIPIAIGIACVAVRTSKNQLVKAS
jgi:hypothetical protein